MARILLALLLLAVATAPLRAAEPVAVPVRVGLHEGYGRIVFDWTRDVDYQARIDDGRLIVTFGEAAAFQGAVLRNGLDGYAGAPQVAKDGRRSEEHTSELQSLMRIAHAVFCLKNKKKTDKKHLLNQPNTVNHEY